MRLLAWLALLVAGAAGGAYWQATHTASTQAALVASQAQCQAGLDSAGAALARFYKQAKERNQTLLRLRAGMALALDQRDAARARNAERTSRRQQQMEQTVHANADCQMLGTMPVCAAVARRLWGAPVAHPTADRGGAH